MVFVAGVEGTGHHVVSSLLEPWCTDAKACVNDCKLSQRIWSLVPFSDISSKSWISNREKLQIQLKDLKNHYEGREVTLFLNTLGSCGSELSYPNFGGDLKAWQHSDVRMLAEVCESEKIDFRIVVLERPVHDVLVSTTVHRHYGTFMQEGRVLKDNMGVLMAQLFHLDESFYSCSPLMSDEKNEATLRRFANFTGIAAKLNPIKRMLENSKGGAHDKATWKSGTATSSPSWDGDEAQFLHLFQNTERLLHSRFCVPAT